ncbi:hypothetical protein B0T24DRAFT_237108 [Lasiosphaeria ovina]|uniref:Uncharacterized protein n=1 Tax=Lasiosphaeria ovina TaxID=92902 RepID=A0AAE0NAX5_9PEZI|nr:hypothetical protein B0T24DRAFT_237108 [Lasiosphaeria ovina]
MPHHGQAESETDTHLPTVEPNLLRPHGLGAGAYIFQSNYLQYLKDLLPYPDRRVEVNIMIQPNSSPHIGTLCNLGVAFVVARRMADLGMEAVVTCDLCDRAGGEQVAVGGIVYQRTLRDTGSFQRNLPDYQELLQLLSRRYNVPFKLRFEAELLGSDGMSEILQNIIENRATLAKFLAPGTGTLAIRAACPQCGLVDRYGLKNSYAPDASSVSFLCPHHGQFTHSTKDSHHFMFNCQLLNLIIGYFYEKSLHNYIEIIGSDYAGFWQEQLLCRFLSKPMVIVYTPLISDWAGAKVSKSLYLRGTAYEYLKKAGMDYLLNYRTLRTERRDLGILWHEIERWIDEPYRLFRGYSIEYIHLLFQGTCQGLLHQQTERPTME